jgi:hypothetical protein
VRLNHNTIGTVALALEIFSLRSMNADAGGSITVQTAVRSSSPYVIARGKDAAVKNKCGNANVSATFALAYEADQKGLNLFL